jgi:hypothetical protein
MKLEPKYKIGDRIKVGNWGGVTEPLEILDIKWIYHFRIGEHCWGYKMDGETGLTFDYVPEGYLRP